MFNNFLIFLKKLKLGMFYLIFSTWQTILNKENIEIIYVYERDINWVDTVKWGIISIIIVLGVLLLVAYAILLERKVLGSIQKRRGPNLVGIFGLLQPIADAVKLIVKETIIPVLSNRIIFIIAPLLTLILSLLNWSIIPFSNHAVLADIRVSILMFFAISSLSVYGIIMSGWASNSKYAFLGALRAAAQVIAYEVSIGLTLIYILIQTSDLNYFKIIWSQLDIWNIIPCFIFFFLFFISTLAETNRPPFDLPEAEAELVSGYNVEYSAMSFGFFFLGEYVSIWTVCCLNVILFWGGFLIYTYESIFIYSLKVILLVITFIWVRGSLPRYRYDQLMRLGWKILLPISLGFVILYAGIYYDLFYKQLLKEYDHYMDKLLELEEIFNVENNIILTDKELIDLFFDAEKLIRNDIIFTDLFALSENINDEEVVNFFLELDCYHFTLHDILCELCYHILNLDILYDEKFLNVTEQDVDYVMSILEQQFLEDIKIEDHANVLLGLTDLESLYNSSFLTEQELINMFYIIDYDFLIEQELINILLTIDEELINLTEQELINMFYIIEYDSLIEQELINMLLTIDEELINLTEQELINLTEQELINMLLTIDEELTEQELKNLTEKELKNILLILEQSN